MTHAELAAVLHLHGTPFMPLDKLGDRTVIALSGRPIGQWPRAPAPAVAAQPKPRALSLVRANPPKDAA